MAAYHVLRSRARERQRVSCGIRGNGWCVTHKLLASVRYQAFSLAEDLEYGIALGLAGYRVHYAGEAHASQDMTVGPEGRASSGSAGSMVASNWCVRERCHCCGRATAPQRHLP
jgi:hypothetical protein